MQQTAWLLLRVCLAIALMIGFYVLAIGVIGGLLWIPYAEYVYLRRVDIRLGIGCVVTAIGLTIALLPRKDRFEPPGPRLDEQKEPRLFAFVRDIAAATRQPMPSEIYVVNEVNAWVGQRGGTMGFGSRRVMGIGLPLLHALPLAEVKSVVAHEFGHYASSDVGLGPWIYATRSAIARAMSSLGNSFIGAPFKWYGRMFMRLTMAISRRQEFVADQMSAKIVGADVAARALRRVNAFAPAYVVYARNEVAPVLQSGFVPPIGEGFRQFLRTDSYLRLSQHVEDQTDGARESDIFDTHPPLRERLAALGHTRNEPLSVPESAATLLSDPDAYTLRLMTRTLSDDAAAKLQPIEWDRVGDRVYATRWRGFVVAHLQWLAPLTVDTLPNGRAAFLEFAKPFKIAGGMENSVRVNYASALLGSALATLMIDSGWTLEKSPGRNATLVNGDTRVEPFTLIDSLASGKTTSDAWVARCHQLGLSGPLLSATMAAATMGVASVPNSAAVPPRNEPSNTSVRRRRGW